MDCEDLCPHCGIDSEFKDIHVLSLLDKDYYLAIRENKLYSLKITSDEKLYSSDISEILYPKILAEWKCLDNPDKFKGYVLMEYIENEFPIYFLQIGYSTFGSGTTYVLTTNKEDMYLEAINRGLDINLPERELYLKLIPNLPNFNWQRSMILWYSKLDFKSERRLVESYVSHGYENMNMKLRSNPLSPAPINDIIAKSIPLRQDVTVYRIIKENDKMRVPDFGEFVSYGYLSTSFMLTSLMKEIYKSNKSLMIIKVPKGTKCIYIPSHELELLFSHNIKLNITSKIKENIVYQIDKGEIKNKLVTIYRCDMLSY